MSFQSFAFLGFFLVTLLLCLTVGRNHRRAGKLLLSAASVVFYLWELRAHALMGLCVLLLGSAVSYGAARRMCAAKAERERKRTLLLSVCWQAAVLLVFKYTGFFTGGAVIIGWAPLGLSFFTFQQIWFLQQVYTGRFPASGVAGFQDGDYVLFSLFFPTISSGPILRPGDFFPQLEGERFLHPGWDDAAAGLYAIALGMGKKVLLADSFGVIVNNGYAQPDQLSAPSAWLVILGYTLQLYFDFSGYCDIATGLARLLGIRLPVNFDSPYRSLSVGEFWKRWHITLTSFLRENVYFPLGGSRRGSGRTYLNIMIVFLVSGFWHGAGWTFILWGALHGLGQVIERAWGKGRDRVPKLIRWGITFVFVNVAWVFFRAPSVAAAGQVLQAAVWGGLQEPKEWLVQGLLSTEIEAVKVLLPSLSHGVNILLILGLYGVGLLAVLTPGNTIRRMDRFKPTLWRGVVLALIFGWSVLSFTGITTFIYSNF